MYDKLLNEVADRLHRLIGCADFDEQKGGGYIRLATQGFVDDRMSALAGQLKAMDSNIGKNLKTELKKFERDVIVYVEHARKDLMSDAAAGKIHFRCLSCDQYTPTVNGPATRMRDLFS